MGRLEEIQRAKTVTTALLEEFQRKPQSFHNDLSSDESVRWYYRKLYSDIEDRFQDYMVSKGKDTLFSMLGSNTRYYTDECDFYGKYTLAQSFQTAGSLFHVLDEDTVDVVVPYGEGKMLISELAAQSSVTVPWLSDWCQRARPYTIALYAYQKQLFSHVLHSVNGVWVLLPEAYDQQVGLSLKGKPEFLEV